MSKEKIKQLTVEIASLQTKLEAASKKGNYTNYISLRTQIDNKQIQLDAEKNFASKRIKSSAILEVSIPKN